MDGVDFAALKARIVELETRLADAQRELVSLAEQVDRHPEGPPPAAPAPAAAPAAPASAPAPAAPASAAPAPAASAPAAPAPAPAPATPAPATADAEQLRRERLESLAASAAALRKRNEELDRANQLRTEFISIAAHEFRTPMTSIVGYLDLISQGRLGPIPEAMQRPIASLIRNTQRLKRLIDEMLDVSRLDSGRMVLHRGSRDLVELVRSASGELEDFARAKGHEVVCDFGAVPPVDVDGDKIHQVITNLLANAIKYTPEGGRIVLSVAVNGPPERPAVVLRVRDNGIGVPEAAREKIFEPFSELTAPQYHSSAGPDSAGLGLYIARGIVLLHGGDISVDSREGEYTEFTVRLPLGGGEHDGQPDAAGGAE
jgi:signal transduction histidine kinase